MEKGQRNRNISRWRRVYRVRKKLKGSSEKPRFSVYKSGKHLFAQLIDDEKEVTLLGLGTQSKPLQNTSFQKKSKEAARHLGTMLAKLAIEKKIERVVFDRGRYKYHGIVKELAGAAREAGLKF